MAMFWTLLEILSAELSQDELDKMITVKNVDDYTPLRLSGYLGQVDLFQAILEQEVCLMFCVYLNIVIKSQSSFLLVLLHTYFNQGTIQYK